MKAFKTLLLAVFCSLTSAAMAQKYVGGDISLLTQYEEHGATFLDQNGSPTGEMLPFLKSQGLNAMRVRLFVDPTQASAAEKGEGVCQDLDYVKALGKRIKDAGLALMLDFHYSDTWADPVKQWTPAAWAALGDADLEAKVYEYTKDALQQMVDAGATPDFIQTGNEISYGMLWGTKGSENLKKCYTDNDANWTRFTNILKQAGAACREVCPQAAIVIHTERVAKPSVLTAFYDRMASNGVDYDVIGLSYYPYYHGTLEALDAVLTTLEGRFSDKNIMIVETGYFHKWQPESVDYDLSATYPITEDGQKAFTEALITTLCAHNKVNGLFWWWPEANEFGLDWNTKRVTDGWYNAGLWDNETGRALSALGVLSAFLADPAGITAVEVAQQTDNRWFTLGGQRIEKPARSGVYINHQRKVVVK